VWELIVYIRQDIFIGKEYEIDSIAVLTDVVHSGNTVKNFVNTIHRNVFMHVKVAEKIAIFIKRSL
jgi:hypothetical protein